MCAWPSYNIFSLASGAAVQKPTVKILCIWYLLSCGEITAAMNYPCRSAVKLWLPQQDLYAVYTQPFDTKATFKCLKDCQRRDNCLLLNQMYYTNNNLLKTD